MNSRLPLSPDIASGLPSRVSLPRRGWEVDGRYGARLSRSSRESVHVRKRPTGGTVEEETGKGNAWKRDAWKEGDATRAGIWPSPLELGHRDRTGGRYPSISQPASITTPLGVNCPLRGHCVSWLGAEALPPASPADGGYWHTVRCTWDFRILYCIQSGHRISNGSHGRDGAAPRFPSPAQDRGTRSSPLQSCALSISCLPCPLLVLVPNCYLMPWGHCSCTPTSPAASVANVSMRSGCKRGSAARPPWRIR